MMKKNKYRLLTFKFLGYKKKTTKYNQKNVFYKKKINF